MSDFYELSKLNQIVPGAHQFDIPEMPEGAPPISHDINQVMDFSGVYSEQDIRNLAIQSENPVEILDNWALSKMMSASYPQFTQSQIFNNLDVFKEKYFAEKAIPVKSALRAMTDEFQVGDLQNANAKLFNTLANMELGLPAASVNFGKLFQGEAPLTSGRENILRQIAVNQKKIDELKYDPVDRNFITTALKWTSNQVPMTLESIMHAIEAGMAGIALGVASGAAAVGSAVAAGERTAAGIASAGKGLGAFYQSVGAPGAGAKTAASLAARGEAAIAGAQANAVTAKSAMGMARSIGGLELTSAQVAKTMVMQKVAAGGLNFAEGLELMRGMDYQQMIEDGRDPKVAAIVSLGSGAVSQALEQFLGIESGLANLVSKGSISNLSGAIMARLHTSGVLQPIAAFAAREVVGTVGEVSAEVLQSLSTNVGTIIARSIAEQGIRLTPQDMNRIAGDMGQSLVQTLVTAPILGIGSNIAMTIGDHKAAREFAKIAPTMTKEAAIGYAKDKKVFGDAMPDAQTEDIAGQAWDEATKRKMEQEAETRDIMHAQAQTRQTEGQMAPERTASGALRIEYEDTGEGVINATVASVNPTDETGTAATYASISLLEDKEAKTLTIDTSEFDERYAGTADEVVGEILAKYPGWQFKLSGVPGPTIEGAFHRQVKLIGAPEASVEDNQARNRVRAWLDETGQFSPARREAALGMMQFLANATRQSFSKFVAPLRGIAVSADAEFNRKAWGMIEFVDGNGQIIQMSDMMKRAGAVITLAENAGPVPFAHEMAHFFVPAMQESDRSVLEAAYGITSGVWKVEHYERLSDEILSFLKEGKLSDEKLRPLFDRIAQWLRGMWRDFKSLDLDPRIRQLFEDWLARPEVREAEVATSEESTTRESAPLDVIEQDTVSPGLSSAVMDAEAEPVVEAPQAPATGGPKPVTDIFQLDPNDVTLNKNFKKGTDRKGQTEPIQGKLRPDHAPITVRKTPKGQKPFEVVTGRHRLNAALRDGVPIRAYIRPETMTDTEAKFEDVEANILDDQGSVEDYAIFFHDLKEKYTYAEAKVRGLLGRAKGRQGFSIGHFASENLYSLYRGGKDSGKAVDDAKFAAISEAARGDEGLEAVGLDNKSLTIDEIQQHILVAKMMGSGDAEASQGDLFGDDASAQQQREEARRMVKSAVDITKGIQKRVTTLNSILSMTNKAERAKAIAEFGGDLSTLDDAKIESELSILEDKLARWKSAEWIQDAQLVAEARRAAGLSYNESMFMADAMEMANGDDGQASLFMEKGNDWVYKSEQVAKAKLKGPMPGRSILSMLRSAGTKEEELKWTGLDEFLDTDKKIDPDDFFAHLDANKLKMEEVVIRDETPDMTIEQFYAINHDGSFGNLPARAQAAIRKRYEEDIASKYSKTRFSVYNLAGGENYREVNFTLGGPYMGYEVPAAHRYGNNADHNRIAHARIDDRMVDGKKMLFIEEIQSDWHQEGRKNGYQSEGRPHPTLDDVAQELYGKPFDHLDMQHRHSVEDELNGRIEGTGGATGEISSAYDVPDAPFKKTWWEIVFRRLLIEAVEKGYDMVGWTTGEQQSDRYGSPQYYERVEYNRADGLLIVYDNQGTILASKKISPDGIQDIVGPEVAEKLLGSPVVVEEPTQIFDRNAWVEVRNASYGDKKWYRVDGYGNWDSRSFDTKEEAENNLPVVEPKFTNKAEYQVVSGLNNLLISKRLKGMKGFYDKMVVDYANKLGKKWGAKVGEARLSLGSVEDVTDEEEMQRLTPIVHSLPVTPEMSSFPDSQAKAVDSRVTPDMNDLRVLFMSKKEKDATKYKAEEQVSREAKDYPSANQWALDSFGIDLAKASDDTREWFNKTWEYHKSGKPKKYAKKGDFSKFLFVRKNLSDFLYAIDRAVNPKNPAAQSDVEARRSRRIKDLISKTPSLLKAVEAIHSERRMPNQKETKNLEIYVKRNEALVKFLYAEVSGDTDLGFEAMSEIPYLAEIDKKSFVAAPGRSLRDMETILKQLKDDTFREKVREGQATVAEFDRYEKKILDAMDKAKEEGRAEAGQEQAANIKSAREESKMNVRLAKEEADERIAVYKIKRHMRRLHDFIMARPSPRMDNRFRKYIELIQQYLKNGQQLDPEFMPSMASIEFAKSPSSLAAMIQVVNSVSSKPYSEWTLENLQDLAQVVGDLGKMGRAQYQFDKATRGYAAQAARQQIEEALKNGRYYQRTLPGVDAEEAEERAKRKWIGLSFMRPDAAIHRLETPKEGHERITVISDLLIRDHSRALEGKYDNTDRRTSGVQKFIFDKGINKTLYDEVSVGEVGPEDTMLRLTRNDLIGIRALIGTRKEFNQKQRQAVVFGSLFSEKEKQYGDDTTPVIPEERAMYGDQNHKGDNYLMRNYERKINALLEATETMLTDDERALAEMMVDVMDSESDWMRFAQAVIDITNREMKKEKWYFPLIRQKPLDSSDKIAEAIVASGVAPMYYESGFTLDRARNIAPHSQVGVRFDAMRMFFDSIDKQEHLINIGPYVKKIQDVFRNSHHSHGIQQMIRSSMGSEGLAYVNELIDTITNPTAFKKTRDGGELISALQGRKYTAYLAWRWSSILMQMGTSPLPFISEAPGQLLAIIPEYIATLSKAVPTMLSGDQNAFIKSIEDKSGELRNRQANPREAELMRLMEKGPLGKINNWGMKGLVWADRTSVALGWEAVYRKKFQEYGKEGADVATAKAKAREYANEVVRKTQVTNEPAFRAPAYRNMDGWKQQVLMFTAPLNVIWNNLAYDVPAAIKEQEFAKAIGLVAAYALSGIIIGATKVARGAVAGPGEDADDEEKARFWTMYWITAGASQFTESIPLIGKYLSGAVSVVTTGRPMIFNNNALPLAESVTTALTQAMIAMNSGEMDSARFWRIADAGFEGLALMLGLPYLGVKEFPGSGALGDFVKRGTEGWFGE